MARTNPSCPPAVLLLAALAACAGSTQNPADAPLPVPEAPVTKPAWKSPVVTRKDASVVDDYHGTKVADPYRWLEDQDGADVAEWVKAQNVVSRGFLDAVPERATIRTRLEQLWNFTRHGGLSKAGSTWFYSRNDGLQNQAVVWKTSDPAQDGAVFLDPNTLSKDGTVALGGFAPNEQGTMVAYSVSARGSDWNEWRVRDVATGADLPDVLTWSKFSSAAWTHDGKGFFYQRYPAPKEGEVYQAETRNPQLVYHALGTAQSEDKVVYERPDQPTWGFGGQVTEDGRYLVLNVWEGTSEKNRIAYVDLQAEGWPVTPLLMDADAAYDFLGNDGTKFHFRTNKDSPRGFVASLDITDAEKQWQVLVPQTKDTLEGAGILGERLVLTYLSDAVHSIHLHKLDGSADGEVALPSLGAVAGMSGKRNQGEMSFSFTSFLYPTTTWRYDFATRKLEAFHPPQLAFDTTPYVVERVFPQSKDGTRLCLFLVRRKDAVLDGSNRTYLYGYGGFNISMTPNFSVARLAWLEQGGIYAHAVLRGGGEYGQEWHEAGMLGNKQNVFDDFIACAEYLVRNQFTKPSRLAIGGGSNGGLLVGACITQRPDLFGAGIPEVGVLDMLRYHKFTIGWAWAVEYGSSDKAEQFPWLIAYSPLHRVQDGKSYPATMVMTGDHDDRVVPGHSFKFAARLQEAQGGPAPILARIETNAGHGAGKPTSKLIDEAADRWAFLLRVLD